MDGPRERREDGPPPEMALRGEDDDEPPRSERHVEVHCIDGQWILEEDGADVRTFPSREKAVATARSRANERKALLTLYDEDERIEEQQDYGTMGVRPSPEADVSGPGGTEATHQAEQRSMHRG